VSSDSDLTSLARRIQESGLFVMGVGRRTTPVAFQRACEEFVFTDDMRASPPASAQKKKPAASSGSSAARPEQTPRRPRNAQPD
ncbi:NYN domain-containing protein, partial [Acinetobacter baumannii]